MQPPCEVEGICTLCLSELYQELLAISKTVMTAMSQHQSALGAVTFQASDHFDRIYYLFFIFLIRRGGGYISINFTSGALEDPYRAS